MAADRFWRACSTSVVDLAGHRVRVAWTHAGICAVQPESLRTKRDMSKRLHMELLDAPVPSPLRRALAAAEKGRADDFPLDLSWARDFERVWAYLQKIPRGETRSYSWLARAARRPLAVRAAASVMANNPLWLLVPCHRVIYADGRLGPYGTCGQRRKRDLLAREGVRLTTPRAGSRKRSSVRPRTIPR